MLLGHDGDDRIDGGEGDDMLTGGAGNDRLFGGDGTDNLLTGAGRDLVTTGAGADTVTATDGFDVAVMDFVSAVDKLDLSQLTHGASYTLHFLGEADFDNVAGAVRFYAAKQELRFDLDGDGTWDAAINLHSDVFTADDLIL